ncbi:MAG: hypothetical protein AAGD09_12365 [Cyanobacteria bacterium P01_F01_bin.56]
MNTYTKNSALFHPSRHGLSAIVNRWQHTTAYHPGQLGQLLNRIGQGVMNWLTTGSLPRVSKTIQGDTEVWKVYDPVSNSTRYFEQELALRVWMEERYYQ